MRPTRNLSGLLGFRRASQPRWYDARLDKVSILVTGNVSAPDSVALTDWQSNLSEISWDGISVMRTRGNGDLPWLGFESDEYSLSGRLKFFRSADRARANFRFELDLNPTKTLECLANRGMLAGSLNGEVDGRLQGMAPTDFFFKGIEVQDVRPSVTLDGNDNVLSTLSALGGERPTIRSQRWGRFLNLYEAKLRDLLESIITHDPFELGFQGELNWNTLTMPYAEVYWEYESSRAHEYMRQIAQLMLESARTTNTSLFHGVERDEIIRDKAALQVVIPLTGTGKKKLALYEKMNDRLRAEIRYRSAPRGVRESARDESRRLNAFFQAFFEEAGKDIKIVWQELWNLIERSEGEENTQKNLMEFLSKVIEACESVEVPLNTELVSILLLDGGITPIEGNALVSMNLCQALIRLGVVKRRRLMQREPKDFSRRYTLADEYQGLRRLVSE